MEHSLMFYNATCNTKVVLQPLRSFANMTDLL
jgi:hypothetical protein